MSDEELQRLQEQAFAIGGPLHIDYWGKKICCRLDDVAECVESTPIRVNAIVECANAVLPLVDEVKKLRNLLRRIHQWDHMDSAADGKFWRGQIDEAIGGGE